MSIFRSGTKNSVKVGLLGSHDSGKTYLFHSMVYRTLDGEKAGALSYYLENHHGSLFELKYKQDENFDKEEPVDANDFLANYIHWQRLDPTPRSLAKLYRLRLRYRTGLLGRTRSSLDVEFLDGPGEVFDNPNVMNDAEAKKLWAKAFLGADIMIFCLPIWAVFPDLGKFEEKDITNQESLINGFQKVVHNFEILREEFKNDPSRRKRLRSILALTMSDDRRSALGGLKESWIEKAIENSDAFINKLTTGPGVANYIAQARKVSEKLLNRFKKETNPTISNIPKRLDLGYGPPWIVPLSAIDGAKLDTANPEEATSVMEDNLMSGFGKPSPAHVELPLLVALCQQRNALM